MRILLVEPNYRSTFPPLGLLRISAFFKSIGITPKFVRGLNKEAARTIWDKIYVSSLFTFELPRTIKTINFYQYSVNDPENDIVVGGVGATLMPEYIKSYSVCNVIAGCLLEENMLGFNEPPIASFTPDYDLLKDVDKKYVPNDAYFTRVTSGCIRKCAFCAVPVLEPKFFYLQSLRSQIETVDQKYGQKHDLVILDNNILALENIQEIISEIKELGFQKDAKLYNRKRFVDFNQGIDVRLITPEIARSLSQINVYPVRIAFDHISVEKSYREGVANLAEQGIRNIMTYVMFNFKDTPEDFYKRLRINIELSKKHNIRITGFPMRFCPINSVDRHYISKNWNWRYLRGIQCILNATHGIVSPRPDFFDLAFGNDVEKFLEIISMPDDYIIYRNKYKNQADEWRNIYHSLDIDEKNTFYSILGKNHDAKQKMNIEDPKLSNIINHY